MAIKNYTSGVDVYQNLGEIQGALAAHGARRVMVDYSEDRAPAGITFELEGPGGFTLFALPANVDGVERAFARERSKRTEGRRSGRPGGTSGTGCWRRWRLSRAARWRSTRFFCPT